LLAEAGVPQSESHFVVGLLGGGFVVGYRRASSNRILATVFDPTGVAVDSEVQLDEPFVGQQLRLDAVAGREDGVWVGVWTGSGSPGDDGDLTSVKARLYDSTTPLGPSFQVNTTTLAAQTDGNVAFLKDGSWVVAFEDDPPFPAGKHVRARRFSPTGEPLGDDFLVSEASKGRIPEIVPLSDGGFVVLFSAFVDDTELGLALRRYDADGTSEGLQYFPVNLAEGQEFFGLTASLGVDDTIHAALHLFGDLNSSIRLIRLERRPLGFVRTASLDIGSIDSCEDSVSLLPGDLDTLTVVWDSNPDCVSDDGDAVAWRLSSDYEPLSNVVQIDEGPLHENPGAALLGPGRAIAAWRVTEQSPPCDMVGRFANLPQPVFVDGFESGDTSAWDQTVP
jgi:hypothetical protein